jgi:hypothetical protein
MTNNTVTFRSRLVANSVVALVVVSKSAIAQRVAPNLPVTSPVAGTPETGLAGLSAPTGGDDGAALASRLARLSAAGGEIDLGSGAYTITTAPSLGTRSIFWNINPGATFSGAAIATWPRTQTNAGNVPVGPYTLCQSGYQSPVNGGLTCNTSEFIQPSGYADYSAAYYGGADSASTSSLAGIEGANFLVNVRSRYTGGANALELDVNHFGNNPGTGIGLLLQGVGTFDPFAAIDVNRVANEWGIGLLLNHVVTGIDMDTPDDLKTGIQMGNPTSGLTGDMVAKQLVNGGYGIFLQRKTDTAATGYFIYTGNAAASAGLFSVDVTGNIVTQSTTAAVNDSTGAIVDFGGLAAAGSGYFGGLVSASSSVSAGGFLRPGQTVFANVATVDSAPQVGDMLDITDASACTVGTQIIAGGGTTHSCAAAFNGVGWFPLVSH